MLALVLALLFLIGGTEAACADPISALIVGALGLTGAAATVGTAVVNIAAALGLGYVSKSLRKPKATRSASRAGGSSLSLQIETNVSRKVIVGRAPTGGSLVYWQTTGTDNRVLQMVIALADHQCHGLHALWVDGKERAWNSGTGVVDGFGGRLKVRFYSGAPGQTADTAVKNASGGRWTDNEVGTGVCYAVVEATYHEATFPGGIPEVRFVVDGALLYDPRLDDTAGGTGDHRWNDQSTWEFSRNPAVIIYNLIRGFSWSGQHLVGLRAPAAAVRLSDFETSANACDEDVVLGAGGDEPRYACGLVLDCDETNEAHIDPLIEAMAGDVIESGGIYRILAGVAQSVVASLTDDDLIVTEPFAADPRRPRTELVNTVNGSFADPTRAYNPIPLPVRASSVDIEEDGGHAYAVTLDLEAVNSRTQGQRVMEIRRRLARRQLAVAGMLRARWFCLEPGDWVSWSSNRRGWVNRTFRLETTTTNVDLTTEFSQREVDAEIDDWSTADELADNAATDLAPGGPSLSSVSGLAVMAASVDGGPGVSRPALYVTWTPITDPTVIEIIFEYRRQGDTAFIEGNAIDPSAGQRLLPDGVQGGSVYEVRARPVTRPERATEWTSWAATEENAPPTRVEIASLAESVPPNTITPEMLDAQSRHYLRVISATDQVLGSMAQQVRHALDEIDLVATAGIQALALGSDARANVAVERTERIDGQQALAQQITTAVATINGTQAVAQQQITALSGAQGALAEIVSTVSTKVDEQQVAVTFVQQSVDGIAGRVGLLVNANGAVVGYAYLDGSVGESVFAVGVDRFLIEINDDGDRVPVFGIGLVNGLPTAALRAELYVDGGITSRTIAAAAIEAIHLAVGSVTADKIAAGAITADKIAAGAITADKINAESITTDKIAVNGLTGNVAASAIAASEISITSFNYVAMSGMALVVTVGANEKILLTFTASSDRTVTRPAGFELRMNGVRVSGSPAVYYPFAIINDQFLPIAAPSASFTMILSPPAGTHTFQMFWRNVIAGGATVYNNYRYFAAMRFLK